MAQVHFKKGYQQDISSITGEDSINIARNVATNPISGTATGSDDFGSIYVGTDMIGTKYLAMMETSGMKSVTGTDTINPTLDTSPGVLYTTGSGEPLKIKDPETDGYVLKYSTTGGRPRWAPDSNMNTIGYDVKQYYPGSKKSKRTVYRYRFLFTCLDGDLTPSTTTSNSPTSITKTLTTDSFDIFGEIFYYSTSTSISANTPITSTSYLYTQAANSLCYLNYSFNTYGTLVAGADVYLVCSPQSDGSVKLATGSAPMPIAYSLPSTEDGYLYKRLGKCHNDTQIVLEQHKPVYYYKNGAIREWTNSEGGMEWGTWS